MTKRQPGEVVAVCPECGAEESWEPAPSEDDLEDVERKTLERYVEDLKREKALLIRGKLENQRRIEQITAELKSIEQEQE